MRCIDVLADWRVLWKLGLVALSNTDTPQRQFSCQWEMAAYQKRK